MKERKNEIIINVDGMDYQFQLKDEYFSVLADSIKRGLNSCDLRSPVRVSEIELNELDLKVKKMESSTQV